MGNVKRFAAINTKVRALERHLLTKDDYLNLVQMESLPDMVTYLKSETSYSSLLELTDAEAVTIDKLEMLFRRELYSRIQGFIHYFTDAYKKLIHILYMRYEIEDLKLFIRTLTRGEDISSILDHLVILNISKSFDYKTIQQAKNIQQLIDRLEGSPFHEILNYYVEEKPEKRIFYMEMNLDRYYFKSLFDQAKLLDPEDQIIFGEILGRNIDLLNLQWIYRGRKFYSLSPEELLNYTLLGGYVLGYKTLKSLCYQDTIEDLVELIRSGQYGTLFKDPNYETVMELNMERYIYDMFLQMKKRNRMNIVETMVYLHQQEYEIRDLFTMFEAKRYGFEKNKTLAYLVCIRPQST